MNPRVRRWIAPPEFPGDAEKTLFATTLHRILLMTMAGLLVGLAVSRTIAARPVHSLLAVLTFMTVTAGAWGLMKARRLRAAALLFVFGYWALTTALVFLSGGPGGGMTPVYVAGTVAAALLAGPRAGLVYATVSVLAGGAYVALDRAGRAPAEIFPVPPAVGLAVLAVTILIAWSVLDQSLRGLAGLVTRLRGEVNVRRRAETALREEREKLRTVYRASPVAMLLLDGDLRVVEANAAAERFFPGDGEPAGRQAGSALRCVQSMEDPRGCGFGRDCPDCPLRNGVRAALAGDEAPRSLEIRLPLLLEDKVLERWLRVRVEPIALEDGPRAIVALEETTERKRYELELERERAFADTLVRRAPGSFFLANADGRFLRWNRFYEAEAGLSPRELATRTLAQVVVPEDRERAEALLAKAAGEGHAADEMRIRTAAGEDLPLLFTAARVTIGGEVYLAGVGVDLGERMRIEDALRGSRERYRLLAENLRREHALLRTLIDHLPVAAFVKDLERRFLIANPLTAELMGAPDADALVGKTDEDFYPPEQAARYRADEEDLLRRNVPILNKDETRTDAAGRTRVIVTTKVPLSDGRGRTVGLVGSSRDLSEVQRAEQELERSRRLLEAAVSQSPAGILIADAPSVTVRYANRAAFAIRGRTDVQLTDIDLVRDAANWRMHLTDGTTPFPADQLPLARAVLEGATSENVEAVIRRDDGEPRWILSNASPVTGRDGRTVAGLVIFSDVTDVKRAEQERQESFRRLERTLESTVGALSIMGEFRDPYTAGHQRRVAELACAVARRLGLGDESIRVLRMAGALHDVGKIYVPAEILSKPGRLSDVEMNIIRMHPQAGYQILKDIQFPGPVAELVYQHHELLDGSGYPRGLAGDAIMVEARVLEAADIVEAMASHRPYRPALGIDRALGELEKGAGRIYDAAVVDACLQVFREDGFAFS